MAYNSLVGKKINYLTVLSDIGRTNNGTVLYRCLCDCGNITKVNANSLNQNHIKSCGCIAKNIISKTMTTHGLSKTRIYKIWSGIIYRCYNKNATSYNRYGGIGVKVCKRWHKFINFYNDMIDGYNDKLTIDRINPKGDYEPLNCKWSNYAEQAINKRNTRYFTIDEVTKTILDWAKETNQNRSIVSQRVDMYGWTPKEAVYGKRKY